LRPWQSLTRHQRFSEADVTSAAHFRLSWVVCGPLLPHAFSAIRNPRTVTLLHLVVGPGLRFMAAKKHAITDQERTKRIRAIAREIETNQSSNVFERVFKKIMQQKPASSRPK
jgi:hypothetical protein